MPGFGINDLETCVVSGPPQCVVLRLTIQSGRLSIIEINERPESVSREEGVNVRFWVRSDLGAFGEFQSVLHVNAQVAHRAIDLGMAEKNLNGAEVTSSLVDDRCFRAP